jgi:hydroxymethylpyrimidine pyrophosphatase-like HAD family hydrolase
MPLRCVYTDLDGTLLGPRGALFRDADGNFSLMQARALEACHRAGVEVVIMSGRRESTVASDARLLGETSYVYEAGCGVMIDGERTYLTGSWVPNEEGVPAERLVAAGIPDMLFEHFGGRLEWHAPWHTGRELSLLMRGKVDVEEANGLIRDAGHEDLRFLDNGVIGRRVEGVDGPAHAYHLVPGGASKAGGVAFHRSARGFSADDCIAIGDSVEDLESAASVGQFFAVANGPAGDEELKAALSRFPNATVTEGAMGDGFYEAVVSTLAMRG